MFFLFLIYVALIVLGVYLKCSFVSGFLVVGAIQAGSFHKFIIIVCNLMRSCTMSCLISPGSFSFSVTATTPQLVYCAPCTVPEPSYQKFGAECMPASASSPRRYSCHVRFAENAGCKVLFVDLL